jgi:signal transduction histidine kinase
VTLSLLLDSKKSYVRYISHELRTPLNTTFLGMRLLIKEFKRSDDPRDLGYFETLNDMSLSCNAALDILNDLLCFEKLESGILDLHKQDVLIVPFIQECVNMFAVQAKESGVTVNILSLSGNLDDDEFKFQDSFQSPADKFNKLDFLAVDDSDVIKIDRFKMDQVIRNLISNALKFTPRNGLITVKIGFAIDRYDPDSSSSAPTNSLRIQSSDDGSQTRSLFSHANSMNNLPRPQLMSRWGSKIKSSKVLVGSVAEGSETIDVEAQMSGQLPGIQDTLCLSRKKDTQPPIEKGKLVIVVTDSGAGISESNQKRLFKEIIQFSPEILQVGAKQLISVLIVTPILFVEAFSHTFLSHISYLLQAGGGSGLGLWITRGIVDLHEGKISVYSAGEGEGKITLFICTLKIHLKEGRVKNIYLMSYLMCVFVCCASDRFILHSGPPHAAHSPLKGHTRSSVF